MLISSLELPSVVEKQRAEFLGLYPRAQRSRNLFFQTFPQSNNGACVGLYSWPAASLVGPYRTKAADDKIARDDDRVFSERENT